MNKDLIKKVQAGTHCIEDVKKMVIEQLCTEYTPEEAIEQVNNAEIIIGKETVTVIYNNGKSDLYKFVTIEKLELWKNPEPATPSQPTLPEELVSKHYDAARTKKPISDHTAVTLDYMGRVLECCKEIVIEDVSYFYAGENIWDGPDDFTYTTPQLIELYFQSTNK